MLALSQIARAISQNAFLPPSGENTALIPRVIAYINAHLSSDLSLDMLSERFYISKFYLSHQFKQYTQLSLHQYILAPHDARANFAALRARAHARGRGLRLSRIFQLL